MLEIQAKNVFFRVFASAIGEIFVFSMILKPHFWSTLIDPMLSVGALAKIYNKVSILSLFYLTRHKLSHGSGERKQLPLAAQ